MQVGGGVELSRRGRGVDVVLGAGRRPCWISSAPTVMPRMTRRSVRVQREDTERQLRIDTIPRRPPEEACPPDQHDRKIATRKHLVR